MNKSLSILIILISLLGILVVNVSASEQIITRTPTITITKVIPTKITPDPTVTKTLEPTNTGIPTSTKSPTLTETQKPTLTNTLEPTYTETWITVTPSQELLETPTPSSAIEKERPHFNKTPTVTALPNTGLFDENPRSLLATGLVLSVIVLAFSMRRIIRYVR